MSVIYPEATPVQGYTSVLLLESVAVETAVDLSTEVLAVGSVNVSCFVRDFSPEFQNNIGNAPARLCTTVQLPVEGNTQFQPIDVRYVYDPQADDTTDDNQAKAFLTRGTEFYALVRKGFDAQSEAFAVGHRYELYKMRAGRQNKVRSGDDEFAEYEISQQWFPLQEPVDGVIVA
jgi:hypothetical protein